MSWKSRNKWKANGSQVSNEYTCSAGDFYNVVEARLALLSAVDPQIISGQSVYSFSDADVTSEPDMVEGDTDVFRGSVTWDMAGTASGTGKVSPQKPPPIGSMSIDFQTNGATAHIVSAKRGLQTTYSAEGEPSIDFKGLIGVTKDGVNGCDIIIPQCQINVRSTFYNRELSPSYIRTLTALTGTVNSTSRMGHNAGELLFAGAFGSMRWNFDDETETTELGFQFLCSKNVVQEPVGPGGTIKVNKKGHQHVWLYTKMQIDSGKPTVYKTQYASVATVYDEDSWDGMRLPW